MEVLILNKDGNPLSMLPLSVVSWQTAIRLLALGKVKALKNHDEWIVRSPSTQMQVPSVLMTTEYVKWNRRVKYNRGNIYLRDEFTCQYCGKDNLHPSELTLDHVLPRSHGGKSMWTNMVTSCRACNHHKGNDRNIVPRKLPKKPSYYELAVKRRKYPIRIRDEYWKNFLDWPEDLIRYIPIKLKTQTE